MTAIVQDRQDWRSRAQCRGLSSNVFVPDTDGDEKLAAAHCLGCPVISQCLAFALASGTWDGVYGGMTGSDRRTLFGHEVAGHHLQSGKTPERILERLWMRAAVSAEGHVMEDLAQELGGDFDTVSRAAYRLRDRGLIEIMVGAFGTIAMWSTQAGAPQPIWARATQVLPRRRQKLTATTVVEAAIVTPVKLEELVVVPVVADELPLRLRILQSLALAPVAANGHAVRDLAFQVDASMEQVASTLDELRDSGLIDDDGDQYEFINAIWILPAGRRFIS